MNTKIEYVERKMDELDGDWFAILFVGSMFVNICLMIWMIDRPVIPNSYAIAMAYFPFGLIGSMGTGLGFAFLVYVGVAIVKSRSFLLKPSEKDTEPISEKMTYIMFERSILWVSGSLSSLLFLGYQVIYFTKATHITPGAMFGFLAVGLICIVLAVHIGCLWGYGLLVAIDRYVLPHVSPKQKNDQKKPKVKRQWHVKLNPKNSGYFLFAITPGSLVWTLFTVLHEPLSWVHRLWLGCKIELSCLFASYLVLLVYQQLSKETKVSTPSVQEEKEKKQVKTESEPHMTWNEQEYGYELYHEMKSIYVRLQTVSNNLDTETMHHLTHLWEQDLPGLHEAYEDFPKNEQVDQRMAYLQQLEDILTYLQNLENQVNEQTLLQQRTNFEKKVTLIKKRL